MVRIKNFLLSAGFFLNILLLFLWFFENHIHELPTWVKVAGRLHPMVLHFPIALLIIIAVLELIGRNTGEQAITLDILLAITAFSAAVAALCGFFLLYGGDYESSNELYWHKIAGILTSVTAGLLCWLRGFRRIIYLPSLLLACTMLIITGHLGSTVTHGQDFITGPLGKSMHKIANIEEAVVYQDIIQPIFDEKCIGCHNPNKRKGALQLINHNLLLKGGENGAVFVAGNPDSSALYNLLLLPSNDDRHMPPEGKPQADAAEIALIRWWISTGADPKQKLKDAKAPDSINKIVRAKYDRGSPLDQLNIPFADATLLKTLDNNDRGIRQLSIEKPYVDVFMANRKTIADAEFDEMLPIKDQITNIDLSYSAITMAQIKKLAGFPHLRIIHLENSNITDDGVKQLASLKYLEYLNLSNTDVTAGVLKQTAGIRSLKKLFLYETNIPTPQLLEIKKQRPDFILGFTPDLSSDTAYRGRLTEPQVVVDSNMFINYATVKMNYRLKGVNIYYTLNGEEPDSTSTIYKEPVRIDRTATLKVIAMRNGWQSSKVNKFLFEKAGFKFVAASLETPPDKRYKAKLDSSLIDFRRGAINATDENYLGFEGNELNAWLDLGSTSALASVEVSYIINHGSLIFAPAGLEVWNATADGKKLERLGLVRNYEPGMIKETIRKTLVVKIGGKPVRYLLVKVMNPGKTPKWHPTKNAKTWIFVDEIIAN
jgi:uncharacterized membrane protein